MRARVPRRGAARRAVPSAAAGPPRSAVCVSVCRADTSPPPQGAQDAEARGAHEPFRSHAPRVGDDTQAQPEAGSYAWTKQWYPVCVVAHTDPKKPHHIQVLGKVRRRVVCEGTAERGGERRGRLRVLPSGRQYAAWTSCTLELTPAAFCVLVA